MMRQTCRARRAHPEDPDAARRILLPIDSPRRSGAAAAAVNTEGTIRAAAPLLENTAALYDARSARAYPTCRVADAPTLSCVPGGVAGRGASAA
jgi:rhodanese-related sulfurtransferase